MKPKIDVCPYCEGTEFVTGKQQGEASISGEGLFSSCKLFHIVCRNCGCVVRSYVENPEELLKIRNRKDL